jgi:phosphate transport system substrate-binding protein
MPNRPISANSLPARHHKHSKLYLIISGVLLLASGVIWMTMKNQTQPQTLPKGYEPPTKNVPFSGITLRGGGSTFVEPMLQRWAELYEKEKQVRIEYQGVGSGLGINGMLDKFYPFGCTDAALSDSRLATILKSGQEIVHIPLVMGAVVPTYNLPDVTQQLRFTGPVLADIFLGKITRWNDPAIQQSNPGVNLPDLAIIVVHREESSGTTFIWTDYLSKASAEWKTKIGANVLPSWPVGIHGKGNNGVSSQISRNVGSLGYVELTFALQNNLKFGMVRNFAGKFISPNLDSVTAAAAAHLNEIPDDLRFSLTDAPGDQSYPIAGTTWAILFVDQTQNDSASQLLEFLRWVTHEGQAHVTTMRFAPLPAEMIPRIDRQLSRIKVKAP